MNTVSRNLAFFAAVFATAFAAQGVDSFITGGWPVAESSVSAYSMPGSVASGRLSHESAGQSLDARFRSDLESVYEIDFDTHPPKGFCVIFR